MTKTALTNRDAIYIRSVVMRLTSCKHAILIKRSWFLFMTQYHTNLIKYLMTYFITRNRYKFFAILLHIWYLYNISLSGWLHLSGIWKLDERMWMIRDIYWLNVEASKRKCLINGRFLFVHYHLDAVCIQFKHSFIAICLIFANTRISGLQQ